MFAPNGQGPHHPGQLHEPREELHSPGRRPQVQHEPLADLAQGTLVPLSVMNS